MARTTHRFTQLSEGTGERKNYLFSIRQEREILPHGVRTSNNLRLFSWHLLPGAYYIYFYAKQYKEWQLSLLVIRKNNADVPGAIHAFIEELKPVKSPPEWLTEMIEKTVHPKRRSA